MAKKKTTPFVWDRVCLCWRKNGRYSKPPTKKELRTDKRRRPIDARGRLVPLAAIAPEPKRKKRVAPKKAPPKKKKPVAKKAPPKKRAAPKRRPPPVEIFPPLERKPTPRKPEPEKSKRVKIERLGLGQMSTKGIEYHSNYILKDFDPLMIENMMDPLGDSFFERILNKSDKEASFVHIISQGIHLRPEVGTVSLGLAFEIRNLAQKISPQARFQILTEGPGHESVKISFPTDGDWKKATDDMLNVGDILKQIFVLMERSFSFLAWDYFFETDEEIYENRSDG